MNKSKKKGKKFESEIALIINSYFPEAKSRRSAFSGGFWELGDIHYDDVYPINLFNFEIKKRKRIPCLIKKAMEQSQRDAQESVPSKIPLVIIGEDYGEPLVILDFKKFLKLLNK